MAVASQTYTRDDIYSGVEEVVRDSLSFDGRIMPEFGLKSDLRAEDIDLLDIGDRLWKKYGISAKKADFVPQLQPEHLTGGRLNENGLAYVAKFPHIKRDESADTLQQGDLTFESLVSYVQAQLGERLQR